MKNKRNLILLLLATFTVLYFMLRKDFTNIMHQIVNINVSWLLLAIFFLLGYWFLRSVILHDIIITFEKKYTYKKSLRLQVLTQFFNAITPFASGGQPFQVYTLKKDGISYNDGTNIIVQEFIIYQLSVVILGLFAIIYNYYFHLFPEVEILESLVAIGFIINSSIIILLFALAYIKKFDEFIIKLGINLLTKFHFVKNKQETLDKWNSKIENFNINAKKLTKNKIRFTKLLIISIFSLLALYLIPCILLYGMGDYTSITGFKSIIACAYVMLIGSFVPIPGGTGGLEYGFLAFFGNFIKGPILSALMLLWRTITYYMGLVIGAILVNVKVKE